MHWTRSRVHLPLPDPTLASTAARVSACRYPWTRRLIHGTVKPCCLGNHAVRLINVFLSFCLFWLVPSPMREPKERSNGSLSNIHSDNARSSKRISSIAKSSSLPSQTPDLESLVGELTTCEEGTDKLEYGGPCAHKNLPGHRGSRLEIAWP
jgi:hypothetical protein